MGASKLKSALDDCLINFDQRVLLTDLLNEYELPYEEVQQALEHYLQQQQEKQGTEYEKRFLVHGIDASSENKEIYTVVKGENKLKEWLAKLTQAESSLYSVEVAGGAKAPAEVLKPIRWCTIKLDKPQERASTTKIVSAEINSIANGKTEPKQEVKKTSNTGAFVKKENAPSTRAAATVEKNKNTNASTTDTSSEPSTKRQKKEETKTPPVDKKPSPTKKKPSPTEKKPSPTEKKSTNQRGINNFFASSSKTTAAVENNSATSSKSKSPKKMSDFFKKQTEKPKQRDAKKDEIKLDTSVELLSDDDKEKEVMEIDSSDEEENLQALRRKAEASEQDTEAEETSAAASSSVKRRRIVDTDDEEDESPQQKHEKKNEKEEREQDSANTSKSETYLDDDGFVITIKSKKPSVQAAARTKTPVKADQKSESKPTAAAQPAPKTKQGNIMSFFAKK